MFKDFFQPAPAVLRPQSLKEFKGMSVLFKGV